MVDILFRADATPALGTGHIMRCLALAEGLHDVGHRCHFAASEITPAAAHRLEREGVAVLRVAPEKDKEGEATLAQARAIGAQAIVVDGYQFDTAWRRTVRGLGRPVLSFFDFAPQGAAHADLILNAAGDPADPAARQAAPCAEWLLGADYVLLRRELRQAMAAPPIPLSERSAVLVTFGGSDPLKLTLPVVEALRREPALNAELDIVIGGSVPDGAVLAEALARLGAGLRIHRDPPDMGQIMRRAGLAMSAGGSTVGELAALAVPTLIAVVADNQVEGTRRAVAGGWCQSLDARSALAPARLATLVRSLWQDARLRHAMAERAQGLVDGQGVARVAAALLRLASRQA